MLTHLDLFSGIGGFALAAQWAGFTTVGFCEIDEYAQQVLIKKFGAVMADAERQPSRSRRPKRSEARKKAKLGCSLIHPDITKLDGAQYRGVTLITGGFPCQPFSCAGKQRGKEDDRYLWPEMLRVVSEARPAWVLGENVAGIIGMELDRVLSDLENIGYAVWPIVIPAVAVDARHRRDRVWIVAHSAGGGCGSRWSEREGQFRESAFVQSGSNVADANGNDEHRRGRNVQMGRKCGASEAEKNDDSEGIKRLAQSSIRGIFDGLRPGLDGCCRWPEEDPQTPRIETGIKNRINRLKGLGNAIVPQVAYQILKPISEMLRRSE